MGRGSQQRRRTTAKRKATKQARAIAERQRLEEEVLAQAQAMLDRLYDPTAAVADTTDLGWDQYAGDPVMPGLVALLARQGSSLSRVNDVADALADLGGAESRTSLTFSAGVAHEVGDRERAADLLDRALAVNDDPETQMRLCPHLLWSGRAVDAAQMLQSQLGGPPDGDLLAAMGGAGPDTRSLRDQLDMPAGDWA